MERSSRTRVWLGVGMAVAALSLAAFFYLRRGVAVRTVQVVRADARQTILVSGRVLPAAEVEVTARLQASVLAVHADEGDTVERGARLASLDVAELRAEVQRARAALSRARAQSGRSRTIAPRLAEESLSRAETQLAEAQRSLEQAEVLVASGAWPEDRLVSARDAVRRAQSAERSAALQLTAAQGTDLDAAQATVREALAALELAERRVANGEIVAPVGGTILERDIETGDQASSGQSLFRLAAEGPAILSVQPDENYLNQLEVGQSASVSADAYPEERFSARVTFLAPAVDPERGTVEVRLLPDTAVTYLRANMSISVEIEVARAERVLLVPTRVVFDRATDEPWVWTVENERARRAPVHVGLVGDETLEVTEGLEEGQHLIDPGERILHEGDRVRVDDDR